MPETIFSHVGVMCIDPIKTEKFYTRHFGFKRARVFMPGPGQFVMLKKDGIYLELFKAEEDSPAPYPTEAGPKYPSWRHICFMVDDLDEKLKEMGEEAKITMGPVDMNQYLPGMKICFLADPDGNIVELSQGYVDETNPPSLKE